MIIRAQKVNSGVVFNILETVSDRPASTRAVKLAFNNRAQLFKQQVTQESLRKAVQAYAQDVMAYLTAHNLFTDSFLRSVEKTVYTKNGAILELDPWGFASGTQEEPVMGDTGSTPTPGRARQLLAYQSPFTQKKEKNDVVFIKDYVV